jgi:hypothetical protein
MACGTSDIIFNLFKNNISVFIGSLKGGKWKEECVCCNCLSIIENIRTTRKQNNNEICSQQLANKNNVNKTWALLQTTGGKDKPNIVLYAEIVTDISQHGTQNVKTHNNKEKSF